LTNEEKLFFAKILSQVTKRYDNLFSYSFAYCMGMHQRPLPTREEEVEKADDGDNVAHPHLVGKVHVPISALTEKKMVE
jgi:UDPglucose--hexose-1-phosphate uridylyltransferase